MQPTEKAASLADLAVVSPALCLASGPTFLSRLLSHPWMIRLGEASYSIYILHWIPFGYLLDQKRSGMQIGLSGLACTILLICGVSLCTYRWIETPIRRAIRGPVALS